MKYPKVKAIISMLLVILTVIAGIPSLGIRIHAEGDGWEGGNPLCDHPVTYYACTKDGKKHFLMCAECFAFQKEEQHVIDNSYTDEEGHSLRCTVCGYVDQSARTKHDFASCRPGLFTHVAQCSICGDVAQKHDFTYTGSMGEGIKIYYCETCRTQWYCEPDYNTLKKVYVPTTVKPDYNDTFKYKVTATDDAAFLVFYCWSDNGKILSEETFDFTEGCSREQEGEVHVSPELEGHKLYWEVFCMQGFGFPNPDENGEGPVFEYSATSVSSGTIRVLNMVGDQNNWEEYAARSVSEDVLSITQNNVSYDDFDDCTVITTELSMNLAHIPNCEVYYFYDFDYEAAPGTVNYSRCGKMNALVSKNSKLSGHTVERNAIALKKGQNASGSIVALVVAYPSAEKSSTYMTALDLDALGIPDFKWIEKDGKKEKKLEVSGDYLTLHVIKWKIEVTEDKPEEESGYSLPYSIEQTVGENAQSFGDSLISLNENMEKNGEGFEIDKKDLISYCGQLSKKTGKTATLDNVILVADCRTDFTPKENETPSTEYTEYLLNITPEFEYRLMFRSDLNKKDAPYITVTNRQELDCTIPIWMRVVLPADFAPHGTKVTVRHREYEYYGTVANDGEYCYLGFENPDGFSDFLFIGGVSDDHTKTRIERAFNPTCTVNGYSGDEICTICGMLVKKGTELPCGHVYGENGICKNCGQSEPRDTETNTLPAEDTGKSAETDGTESPKSPILAVSALIAAAVIAAAVVILLLVKKKKSAG